jgi:LmbE family N-acetylglucosaminyl deacetylase
MRTRFVVLSCILLASSAVAQPRGLILPPVHDARMKADILLIVAHPDDETAIGPYLAKVVFDLHKSVAIIYCNRGTGGGNNAGIEQGKSMGLIREIEVRRATAHLGIDHVWVLNGRDTPSQDIFQSLQNWNHGTVLEDVVRIVRLTRPEVIITWMPQFVAGENHGDHQAAGVIATEAFDCAGDPTVFPSQVAFPREQTDINNHNEGLAAWQPKKLYYYSDASHPVAGEGPSFAVTDISPSMKKPYFMIGAEVQLPHKTQGDVSANAEEAARTSDYAKVREYLAQFRLLFGKSVVPCAQGGDVFEGVGTKAAAFMPHVQYTPAGGSGIVVDMGGVFAFYRDFWRVHGIERIAGAVPYEMEVTAGSYLNMPLLLRNGTAEDIDMDLTADLPEGWHVAAGPGRYRVPAGAVVHVQAAIECPHDVHPGSQRILWHSSVAGKAGSSVTMTVRLVEWALPQ